MCNEDVYAEPLMKSLKILNIYQLNICQTLILMKKAKLNQTPNLFLETLQPIT